MKWGEKAGPVLGIVLVLIVLFLIVCFFLFQVVVSTSADDRVNLRLATRQAPVTLHSDKVVSRRSVPIVELYMEISAYSPSVQECDAAPLITASGQKVRVGGVAADLRKFPLGTRLRIPGYNNGKPCTVIDSGGSIKGNRLDVFMWETHAAIHWGRRRNVRVEVLYVPGVKK